MMIDEEATRAHRDKRVDELEAEIERLRAENTHLLAVSRSMAVACAEMSRDLEDAAALSMRERAAKFTDDALVSEWVSSGIRGLPLKEPKP